MQIQSRRALALALAAAVAAPGAAHAHAFLASATPAVGSSIAAAPTEVAITFTEGVEPAFSRITVSDAAGTRVDQGKPHLDGDDRHLAVALLPLKPGKYQVSWQATATDTHRTRGSFTFTLQP